jgi:hypothetical protein
MVFFKMENLKFIDSSYNYGDPYFNRNISEKININQILLTEINNIDLQNLNSTRIFRFFSAK